MPAPPRKPTLLTPRPKIWLISIAIAAAAWFVVTWRFGFLAVRHGELFISHDLEWYFFTFTWLKQAGFSGRSALQISELIFGLIVFTLSVITLTAWPNILRRAWRRLSRNHSPPT